VEKIWGYCPFCRNALDKPYRVRRRSSVDKEEQTDTASIALGLVVMSLMGAVGIILFFVWGGIQMPGKTLEQSASMGMILSALLFLATVVGVVLAGKRTEKEAKRIIATVIGTLSIPFLLCAGVLSWLIYVTAGCSFK
jgi:uncharacterized membrane protein YozB (DUF420 family)